MMNPAAYAFLLQLAKDFAIPLICSVGNGVNQEYDNAHEIINSSTDMTGMQRIEACQKVEMMYWAKVFLVPGAITAPISRFLPKDDHANEDTEGCDEKVDVPEFWERMISDLEMLPQNWKYVRDSNDKLASPA